MGATTMTDVKAVYLGVLNNQNIFAVSEETYEMNVYPHTPSFCLMMIGTYQDCMERAKEVARSIPGGMLKGYTVNSIMNAFDKALRNPVGILATPYFNLQPKGAFNGLMEDSYSIIEKFHPEIASQLQLGLPNKTLSLLDNLEMAVELSKTVAAWRFASVNIHGRRLELNIPKPTEKPKNAVIPEFAAIPLGNAGAELFFKKENGCWVFAEQEFWVRQDFIESLTFSTLAQFKKDMRAFNKALKNCVRYGDVKLTLNNPIKDIWSGSDEFNKGLGKALLLSTSEDSYLFEKSLKVEGNLIELLNPLESNVFEFDLWHTAYDPEAKRRLKDGTEIETKDPIVFNDGTKSKRLQKASLTNKRNVWYDLDNKGYVRISPKNLGAFKFLKVAARV